MVVPKMIHPPSTWQELFDRDYTVLLKIDPHGKPNFDFLNRIDKKYHDQVKMSQNDTKNFKLFYDHHFQNQSRRDEYFSYLSKTPGLAIIWWAGSSPYDAFNFNSTGHYILKNSKDFRSDLFAMSVRRQFVYYELFNKQIRTFWEMGLAKNWMEMANYDLKVVPQQQVDAFYNPPKPKNLPEPINPTHIYGPVIFLAIGLFLSLLAFVVEMKPKKG